MTWCTNLPDEVLRNVGEVIWPRHICMTEQISLWILRLIAIPEEELEKVEQPQPF